MNRLPTADRVAVLKALTEGCSLRSTSRMTGVAFNTVVKLLIDAGRACAEYQHNVMRNLPCRRLQLDEVWSFVGAKDKNIPAERQGEAGIGSVWTWIAIDAETKLVPSWLVGLRDMEHAVAFVGDPAHVSTSYIERQNLTLRMRSRRFTRLTNAFSKKLANHEHAIALYFMHYNFIARHGTLRMPPALKAGVTDHWWEYGELVELIDRAETARKNNPPPN